MGKGLGLRVVLAVATQGLFGSVRSPIDVLNRARKRGSLVAVSNDSSLYTSGDLEV